MRLATLAAAFALLAAPALADPPAADSAPAAPLVDAPAGDPSLTDMRCMVVASALLGSDDEQMKSLGRANLFYYLGRLQGRGDVANMDARIVEQAAKMTEDDIRAEAKGCGAMFTAAAQALQDMSNAFEQHFGGQGGAAPAPAPK